jgi:phage terminase large subunit GpA-like protein
MQKRDSLTAGLPGLAVAACVLFGALGAAAEPAEYIGLPEWCEAKPRMVSGAFGSPHPGPWRNDRAPFLVEPMRRLEWTDPCNVVSMRFGAQTGKSEVGTNWALWTVDVEPEPMMAVLPSREGFAAWNQRKWGASLDEMPELATKVLDVVSSDGTGSTTGFKKFKGGFLRLETASSSKGLQGWSLRRGIADELTEWPATVGDRGSPLLNFMARFDGQLEYKVLLSSTPGELSGDPATTCQISKAFMEGDQRMFYVLCPHCDHYHTHEPHHLQPDDEHGAVLICPSCGVGITDADKPGMQFEDGWIATFKSADPRNPQPPAFYPKGEHAHWRARPTEGREPSYHLSQLYSRVKSLPRVLKQVRNAEGDPEAEKVIHQQVYALPWDPARDAPKHEVLLEGARANKFVRRGIVPHWAPWLTLAVDCQADRLEWALYACGPKVMARIDRDVIPFDPVTDEAWVELAKVLARRWESDGLEPLGIDVGVIDSGGKKGTTARVYDFCSRSPNLYAVKGSSQSMAVPFERGKRKRAKLPTGREVVSDIWFVNGDSCKTAVYQQLRVGADACKAGQRVSGAIYLEPDTTEEDVLQLTAEVWRPSKSRRADAQGNWERLAGRANEQLDMAVYSWAVTWARTARWTDEQWAQLQRDRARQPDAVLPLFETLPAPALPARLEMPVNPGAAKRKPGWMTRLASQNGGRTDG